MADEIEAPKRRATSAFGGAYAVYSTRDHWLVDTGVGGTYSTDVEEAQWFPSRIDARDSLRACDLIPSNAEPWQGHFLVLRVK